MRGFFVAIATAGALLVNGVNAANIIVEDFESVTDWSGLVLNNVTRLSGTASGSWDGQTTKTTVKKIFPQPIDASGAEFVQFWAYSGKANGAQIELVFDSENPVNECSPCTLQWDYYRYRIDVDWTGWRYFRIPLSKFYSARQPLGWNKINYVALYSAWGDHPALPDTALLFDDMSFSSGMTALSTRNDGLVGGDYVYSYKFAFHNGTTVNQDLALSVQSNADFTFNAALSSNQVALAPGESAEVMASITIPADQISVATLGVRQTANLLVRSGDFLVEGQVLPAAIPFPQRSHPRTALIQQDFDRMKSWATTTSWAGGVIKGILSQANTWKSTYADKYNLPSWQLPPEGGQWWHWYVSKAGVRLTYDKTTGTHIDTVNNVVYDGWPYDQVVYGWMHSDLANHARDSGLAYQLSGDLSYAQGAKEILLAYADAYRTYPFHDKDKKNTDMGARVMASVLDENAWVMAMAWAYDLVADSGILTEAERQHIEQDLLRETMNTIYRLNPVPWESGAPNQQAWNNAAIAMVGFALNDSLLIWDAMRGTKGFEFQMANRVSSDGLWSEGSWGYHFYTLTPLTYIAEMASRSAYGDVYSSSSSLRAMFESPLRFAMPNSVLPAFNDGTEFDLKTSRVFESPYLRYSDIRHLFSKLLTLNARWRDGLYWGASEIAPGEETNFGSTLFPESGYAILRAGVGAQSTYLALDYGPHGLGHGHPDKLGFVSYSRGGEMGVDPGTVSYSFPAVDSWYKETLAHNTVVVGTTSQNPATGTLRKFAATPALSYAAADGGAAYPTTSLLRTLVLSDDYILDRYRVHSTSAQTVDWIYHNQGSQQALVGATLCPTDTGRCLDLPSNYGYQHLQNVSSATREGDWETSFGVSKSGEPSRGLRLHMLGESGTTVYTGTALGPNVTEPLPFVMVRRQSADTTYVSLMEPYAAASAVTSFQALTTDALSQDEAVAVEISAASYTDRLLAIAGETVQTRRSFGSGACDGDLCMIRKAGEGLTRLVIAGGASMEDNCVNAVCEPVLISNVRLSGFQADIDRSARSLTIHSVEPVDSTLRLYFPGAANIETVTVNGQPVNFMSHVGHVALNEVNPQFDLLVEKAGTGASTVSSSPLGINCGTDCSESYDANTSIVLEATAGPHTAFTGWSGCDSVTATSCTINMSTSRTVTANFLGAPDLIVANVAATQSGTSLVISDRVSNVGSVGSAGFDTAYHLSSNATYEPADVLLCKRAISALTAGASNPTAGTTQSTCDIPSVAGGNYYVIARADSANTVAETNEANNASASAIAITGIDLLHTALAAGVESVKVRVSDSVKNQGNLPAGGFAIHYYLSTNQTYEPTDMALASSANGTGSCSRSVGGLGSSAVNSALKGCYKPSGATKGVAYYVVAVIDAANSVGEYNESNNAISSQGTIQW